jgi:hypothetical protein
VFSFTTKEVDRSHDSLVKKLSNPSKKVHRREWSNKLPYLKEKGMHSPSFVHKGQQTFIHKVWQRWQGKLMFVTFMG